MIVGENELTQALIHGSPKIALNWEHYNAVARGEKDASFGS